MTAIKWDVAGERRFENGVDHGVLYLPDAAGKYLTGVPWNGLVTVTEKPTGADATRKYADNINYFTLHAAEEFGATVEAFTYPDEFGECDGTAEPKPGVLVGQQRRKSFGLCYRTKVGTDLNPDTGYKLHLVYNCTAAPSERAYGTINDSPDAITFSWDLTTTPVDAGEGLKPTATLTIDSTRVDADDLAALEAVLYGTPGTDPRLPSPDEVIAMMGADPVEVVPAAPTYDAATHTITIPTVAGVTYWIDNDPVTGNVVITEDTVVSATANPGSKFPMVTDDDWLFEF